MLSLVVKSKFRVHFVLPKIQCVVVIDTELGGILLEKLVDINHASLVLLSSLPLCQAPQIFNLFAFCLIIGDLTLHSAFYLFFTDIGKLMSR